MTKEEEGNMADDHYIDLLPLQPPFHGKTVEITFAGFPKIMVLSSKDFDRLCNFLGCDPSNCHLELSPSPRDDEHIRIRMVTS